MAKKTEVDHSKLMFHPKRIAEWMEKGDCFPIYAEIGPTNRCNHKCIFCSLDWLKHGTHDIDKDVMDYTLKDMARQGVLSVMFAGEGEPLLHKDIGHFTQEAKKYGLDVAITTNGVAFTKEKREQCLPNLKWIRFSVDAGTPETYAEVHKTIPADFSKVIENIEQSAKFRDENKLETTIGIQFLMIPNNIEEAGKLGEIAKKIGADNLQIKPYCHHPNTINDLHINHEEYNRLEDELMKFNSPEFQILFRKATIERIEEGITYPKCYGLPFFTLIDAKGNVIPCNIFYDNKEFIYGNLYEQKFSEIWKGKQREKVLEQIYERGTENCTNGCRLNSDNRYLHRLKNPLSHDRFI